MRYTVFMVWKTQNHQDSKPSQTDLQIQCNSNQILTSIWHWQADFRIYMKRLRHTSAKTILIKYNGENLST